MHTCWDLADGVILTELLSCDTAPGIGTLLILVAPGTAFPPEGII